MPPSSRSSGSISNCGIGCCPIRYSAVHECAATGLPVVRALWLHYPNDPASIARGDEYLWGRDLLVAPVVDKGATSRTVYLPPGRWFDFWTEASQPGGREIVREVDLATLPLFVRAGAVVPLGPVRQYADQPSDEPTMLVVYPGADGTFLLYEDDGATFDYQRGDWMGVTTHWADADRRLTLALAPGSRMRAPAEHRFVARLAGRSETRPITFTGRAVSVVL